MVDHHARCISDRPPAGQTPASVRILDAVVEHIDPAIDDLGQIRRTMAVVHRRGAICGRPGLLQSPVGTIGSCLRQHLLPGGMSNGLAVRPNDGCTRFQFPVSARRVFDVDSAIKQRRSVGGNQHGRQLARLVIGIAPGPEDVARLPDKGLQVGRRHRRRAHAHERGEVKIIGNGNRQIGDLADAFGVNRRTRLLPGGSPVFAVKDRVGQVGLKHGLERVAAGAIRARERAAVEQGRALWRFAVERDCGEVDRNNA